MSSQLKDSCHTIEIIDSISNFNYNQFHLHNSPLSNSHIGGKLSDIKTEYENKQIINSKQIFDLKQDFKLSYPGYDVWYEYCIISLVILFIFTENSGNIYIS